MRSFSARKRMILRYATIRGERGFAADLSVSVSVSPGLFRIRFDILHGIFFR